MSGDKDYVKDKMHKRKTDIWNENSLENATIEGQRTESFVRNVYQNPEGISADREKFIHGLNTASHKVLPPNKKVE